MGCSHVFGLICAVHMTAGHNALRGSGPGQNPAFDNALALDCMSPPQNEATHPRCCDEGCLDGPGKASNKGGRVVGHHTEVFVGIDTSKSRNAIAIADGGRGGEVRYLGEFPATEAAIRKLVAKLAAKCCHLTFGYEAGPTGYGLYRLLKSLGHDCLVVAPSLVPKKAGDRVKTNRRDAVSLAKLLRAGHA